jgi:hypothetical protein
MADLSNFNEPPIPCGRRLQFRLLALLILVVVICGALLGIQMKRMRHRRDVRRWAQDHPGDVGMSGTGAPVDAPWDLRILGEPAMPAAIGVTVSTAWDRTMVTELRRLFPGVQICVTDTAEPPSTVSGPDLGPAGDLQPSDAARTSSPAAR